jgi:tetratricopeptide (TPR) repeat protein
MILGKEQTLIFYSYASEDKLLQERLEKHLSILKYVYDITSWCSREICAKKDWASEIDSCLEAADIILFLISADFLASGYCYGVEMTRALERHEKGEKCLIPIILRPVDWKGAPFEKLQVLPKNAKPVTSWRDRDKAFVEIAHGLREVIDMQRGIGKEIGIEGMMCADLRSSYEKLIDWCKHILRKRSEEVELYCLLADALKHEGQYDEALAIYKRIIQLHPHIVKAYYGMGNILYTQAKFSEARAIYEHAIQLDPTNPYAYYSYSILLSASGQNEKNDSLYKEAIRAYKEAIAHDPRLKLSDPYTIKETADFYQDWEYALQDSDRLGDRMYRYILRKLYEALSWEEWFETHK